MQRRCVAGDVNAMDVVGQERHGLPGLHDHLAHLLQRGAPFLRAVVATAVHAIQFLPGQRHDGRPGPPARPAHRPGSAGSGWTRPRPARMRVAGSRTRETVPGVAPVAPGARSPRPGPLA
ncbi:hypothetical protein G6F22_012316 [Rhizopus arrhizus]|nr:hypothetical protein G6F22_012316 [Rhizopus arrhizus]